MGCILVIDTCAVTKRTFSTSTRNGSLRDFITVGNCGALPELNDTYLDFGDRFKQGCIEQKSDDEGNVDDTL